MTSLFHTLRLGCRAAPAVAVLAALAWSCVENGPREASPEPLSPNARPELVAMLREDLEAPRSPADLGGRAWLNPSANDSTPVAAGTPGRWTIVYEAGPLGIAEGGALYLQVPAFWGWSPPQPSSPEGLGYTTVHTEASGVALTAGIVDDHLLRVRVQGRALAEGERITLVYGAGPAGAVADRYAERESRFWIAVDGDGDGVRAVLADSPAVEIGPGPPARMLLTLPSTARVGETVRLAVAVLDARGNAGCVAEGDVALEEPPRGLRVRRRIPLEREDRGVVGVPVRVESEGIYRLTARGPGGLTAESNPLVVAPEGMRILWADLQIHSNLSDGTATPEQIYAYARDVAALDVAAVTDHDHWGMLPLAEHDELWRRIRSAARRFHEPRRFVTVLGYEWTNWIHGHRHVLYFDDRGPASSGDDGGPDEPAAVLSSVDARYDQPRELWRALRGRKAMTIAHHPAGEPVATNWEIAPDPALESVVEVVSVHGSSEADDAPLRVDGAREGHFARDALDRGYRLGFVGSGDGHDGHPGLAHLNAPTGGVAALLSEELTREGVYEALRARRVYATSGPRIVLRTSLAGRRMGEIVERPGRSESLRILVVAPDPLLAIDVIRSGETLARLACDGKREVFTRYRLEGLAPGEYVYVRAIQENGGMAVGSPFFIGRE